MIFALGPTPGHANELQKRVLLIYPYTELIPSTAIISETVRARLKQRSPIEVDFRTAFLDLLRVPDEAIRLRTAQYLADIYKGESFDVIVALYAAGLRFAVKYRELFAPNVPIVFCCPPSVGMSDLVLPNDVIGILGELHADKTLELAEQLQPDAKNLVIISGSANLNRNGLAELRPQLSPYLQRFKTTYLTGVTYDEVLKSVSSLPRDTIVLYYSILADSAGRTFVPAEAAGPIARAASVPVYGLYDTYMGTGIVGGHMASFEEQARSAADLVLDIMSGKPPHTVVPPTDAGTFRVDERQLRRWGLNERRLPANTIVYFKQPTAWDQYRWQITAIAVALFAQLSLICGLFYERHRRRRAEIVAHQRLSELAHMNRSATAGELSASIAHEIKQPLGAIAANGRAGLRWLRRATPDLGEAEAALESVVNDAHRASDIVGTIRTMFKKGDQEKIAVDLNLVVKEVLGLLRTDLQRRQISVVTRLAEGLPQVMADRVQLQQVVLNLIVNAADAMVSIRDRARVVTVATAKQDVSGVLVTIEDSGTGVDAKNIGRIFEPFYTTKSEGMGMGLSICRSIIESYGGQLSGTPGRSHGLVMQISLPTNVTSGTPDIKGASTFEGDTVLATTSS
jgi:signal transduction histidine kinase